MICPLCKEHKVEEDHHIIPKAVCDVKEFDTNKWKILLCKKCHIEIGKYYKKCLYKLILMIVGTNFFLNALEAYKHNQSSSSYALSIARKIKGIKL